MIKKLASHLGEYKRAAILTPMFSALEAVMDILLPTIMAFIIDLGIEKGDMNAIVKYGLLTFAVAAIAMRCMRISSITPSPTSTNSPPPASSPV